MALGVLDGRSEVVDLGFEDEAFLGDLEMLDLVVLLRVENSVAVGGEVLAEMDVVAVGPETFPIVRLDDDLTTFHRCEDLGIRQYHKGTDTDGLGWEQELF